MSAGTVVEIDAPLEVVWAVLTDFGAYGEWNPFVVAVQCHYPPRLGDPVRLDVRLPGGMNPKTLHHVSAWEPPGLPGPDGVRRARFAYTFGGPLARLRLVHGERTQVLTQAGAGPTRYVTEDRLDGGLVGFVPIAQVQAGFDLLREALKRRAEALARR